MKDELGGDIITEFLALRPKAYSYITNDFIEMKKAKGTKKCVVNKMLRFDDYKKCLFDNGKVLTQSHNKGLKVKKKKKKNFMAPFYGWGSTASRLEPLRGGSLLFTTKFPEVPGTHFIDLERMKG